MTISVKLRKMLHRKSAEFCTPSPVATSTGAFILGDKTTLNPKHDGVALVAGPSAIWNYNADEDSWMQLPNSGIGGTFSAGVCGCLHPRGMLGSASTVAPSDVGTTSSFTLLVSLARNLAGVKILVTDGTNAGYEGTIVSNTVGPSTNTVDVSPAAPLAFDTTSSLQILSGSLWFITAGTSGFMVYDRATNNWTTKTTTGMPATLGTDAVLLATPAASSNGGEGFVTGTSTGSNTSTKLYDTTKHWANANWANFRVRIVGGTGAGQVREISSSGADVLNIGTAWSVTPDSTSTYVIEGNDDYLYLMGNNAVALYRYKISTNSWSTLAPTVARAGAPGAGSSASWVDAVPDSTWSDGLYGGLSSGTIRKQLGRYIYSFRGGNTNILDVYDIAANKWVNGLIYGGQMETFGAGSSAVAADGSVFVQKDATGRIYRFDIAGNYLEPFATNPVPQGTAVVGAKMFIQKLKEGSTELTYLYTLGNTRSELTRWLVI